MKYSSLPILETERLILRPITMDDIPAIYHYAKDPEVSKLLEWYPPKSIEDTITIVQRWIENYSQNKEAPWGIVDKKTNSVIGTIDVRHYDPTLHRAVLGYCLSREYWGKGLMVEAIKHIIAYLFSKTDIIEVAATCRIDNPQSQRVLEKAGFFLDKPKAEQAIMKGHPVTLDRWVLKKLDFSC